MKRAIRMLPNWGGPPAPVRRGPGAGGAHLSGRRGLNYFTLAGIG